MRDFRHRVRSDEPLFDDHEFCREIYEEQPSPTKLEELRGSMRRAELETLKLSSLALDLISAVNCLEARQACALRDAMLTRFARFVDDDQYPNLRDVLAALARVGQ
jgi:hypothetical protein